MVSIGMVPMVFLLIAVNTFLYLVFYSMDQNNVRIQIVFLINWWMVFLALASILWFVFYGLVYFLAVTPFISEWPVAKYLDRNIFVIENTLMLCFSAYSLLTALITTVIRSTARSHGWMRFTAWAFFGRFLVPLVWDPMPNLVYRYDGLFGLPVLYGLLMVALSLIHERYPLPPEAPALSRGAS